MIVDSDSILDPATGKPMKKSGTARRIVKKADNKFILHIPVYYCESEDRYHRILPNFLVKFKHYTVETIAQAINDDQDLDLADLPSDSSRKRWKDLAYELLRRKAELRHSATSDSLSHSPCNNNFHSRIDTVKINTVKHRFTTGELAGLLNLPISKRL